jgi:chromate transporter
METGAPNGESRGNLRQLTGLFLQLGTIAVGGPAAHVALMQREVVNRRKWLTNEQFLDLLGASQLIPGPNSTEMAIHIGYHCAGWMGLLIAGLCFILPATLIVMAIAWLYVTYGTLPAVQGILYGLKPVIIAIVLQATVQLGRSALKSTQLWVWMLVSLLLAMTGVPEWVILLGSGLIYTVWRKINPMKLKGILLWPLLSQLPVATGVASSASVSLAALTGSFVKAGALLFGSGYVLVAFLQTELVERHGWLTTQQLADAIAVGQITPGPVFTTATFIGYVLQGPAGAFWATVGIFAPAFVFVALTAPWVHALRDRPTAGFFLDGVNVAAVALILVAVLRLFHTAVVDVPTLLMLIASVVLLLKYNMNSAWLCLAGAIFGLLLAAV